MWRPELRERDRPLYRAIASALAEDIREARLAPGTRLPTQRELARAVGVTVGTVSRAYAEAEMRGLVVGHVGRGTFVRDIEPGPVDEREPDGVVDMSYNFPPLTGEAEVFRQTLSEIAGLRSAVDLLGYQPSEGTARHRAAGARWLARTGLQAEPGRTLVTAGAQHAIAVLCATLLRSGERVLAEELTYPGMKGLACMLGLDLEGLPGDPEGLSAEAFERACHEGSVRALYTIPTIQNPTGTVMSESRRREIAAIAKEHGVLVIEDDVHGLLPEDAPPPIAAFHPEGSFYVASLAKTLSPGLRVGYLHAPPEFVDRLAAGIRTTIWMASPLSAEIATRWIDSGAAEEILGQKRREAAERQAMVRERLGDHGLAAHEAGFHAWLPLPPPWRTSEFVAAAEQRGVRVSGAEAFAVGRGDPPHAVRLCLGSPRGRHSLRRALDTLRELLEAGPEPYLSVV